MPTSRPVSGSFVQSSISRSGSASGTEDDIERLRSLALLSSPTLASRLRGLQSPALSLASEGAGSFDDGDGPFDLPPSSYLSGSWTVDPNFNVPENFSLAGVDLTSARLPDRMRDLMDDYAYWLSLVERLGFDRSIFQFSDIPSLECLSRYFDSSHLGLLRVFHIFDKDKDTLITKIEISEGLQQQGFYTNAGSQGADLAFVEFCDLLTRTTNRVTAAPANQVVSPPEFLLALRCLRLAAVVHGFMRPVQLNEDANDILLNFHEYREDRILTHLPLEGPISFLFRSPDEEAQTDSRVYWIHAHEPTIRTVLALGVKYGLDPRFTLDVLSLWKQQALVDRALSYVARTRGDEPPSPDQSRLVDDQPFLDREWIFSIIPVIRLSEASAASMMPFNEWRLNDLRSKGSGLKKQERESPPEVFVEVDNCNIATFVTGGEPLGGTVITFSSEWSVVGEVDTSNDLNASLPGASKWVGEPSPDEVPEVNDFQPFSRIMNHLRTSYSHLRTGDCHTLFLKALCDITEDYVAVIQSYEAALTVLRRRLDQKRDSLERFEVQRIQGCLRQVTTILRLVRPVAAVVDILETRDWSGDSKLYLSDVKANVNRFLDNASATRETAKLMGDQFRNYNETKTRKVLFALTLVTTMFVPGMFLVSLEGMNFQHGMIELHVEHGYLYFLGVLLVTIMVILGFYRWMKWI